MTDQPCTRCHFTPTPDGQCICRVPTEDDVPLWEVGGDE